MNSFSKKNLLYLLIFFSYFFYFVGFFLNENSIGSGGYNGDLRWIWKNFDIFKNNSLLNAISNESFFGNRTPLLYIINILFNPFIDNIYYYRLSIFIFSLIGPIIFYYSLKLKYYNVDNKILFLISSIILLSPYYRTSAYWGMEVHYAIIAMLSTYYFYLKINFNLNKISIKNLFLIVFFSSITIYFDQKYLFLPLFVFLKIYTSNFNLKTKALTLFFFILYSLPYLYLINIWGGIVPIKTQLTNTLTITNLNRINFLHFEHLGYATSIIAFYIFPFFVFFKVNIFTKIKEKFYSKNCLVIFFIFLIYLIYLTNYLNFEYYSIEKYSRYNFGLGITHKLSILLSDNIKIQEVLTYVSFFVSWLIIYIYFEKKIFNLLFILFFLIISLFLFPIMQEYYDLVLTVTILLVFKNKIKINYERSLIFFSYFSAYLILCITYYSMNN